MNRRETTIGLLALFGSASAVRAQQLTKIPRVGVLGNNLASAPAAVEAFRRRLTELGYVDGRNIVVEYRSAGGKPERLPVLAAELVALPVDVIVATGGILAARPAREATATIPIVFIAVGDPVREKLVASLARPGGNCTGLSSAFPDAGPKLLQLVREVLPRATRVAILVDTNQPPANLSRYEEAAQTLGMHVQAVEVRGGQDFERAFADMTKTRTDALIVFGSSTILGQRKQLAEIAAKHRMPMVAALREYTEAGGLLSYGPDLTEMFVAAANYVDRILKGAKPSDLPVEQPTKFELVVRRETADALGITIPQSVLLRATVI